MQEAIIQAQALTKVYGSNMLLKSISLTISRGQCTALMGHNGCGKTTLLRVLANLAAPTSGKVEYAGRPTFGYVPEAFPKSNLTALQYITHMGKIEGLSAQVARDRGLDLFADFFMGAMLHTPMKHLSKGSLQKVGVIQALLCPHDVLLLDEPLNGQDIESQQVFIEKARQCKQNGTAIVLSCHEPYLVNRLADAVYEIKDGKLLVLSQGDVRLAEHDTLLFDIDPDTQPIPMLSPQYQVSMEGRALRVHASSSEANAFAARMIQAGYRLKEYRHASDV